MVYREPQLTRSANSPLEILQLPESMAPTTVCLYYRDKALKTNRLSAEAEGLMRRPSAITMAIRRLYRPAAKPGTANPGGPWASGKRERSSFPEIL